MTRLARKLSCRLLSLLLAAMWGALILLGAVSMGRCTTPMTPTAPKKSAACVVCHCAMCHTMHPGGMTRCCCHTAKAPATQSPSHQAMLCARCDQGGPVTPAALAWHLIAVLPGGFPSAVLPPRAEALSSPAPSVSSRCQTPPSRPPLLL